MSKDIAEMIVRSILAELNDRGCFDIGELDAKTQREVKAALVQEAMSWLPKDG